MRPCHIHQHCINGAKKKETGQNQAARRVRHRYPWKRSEYSTSPWPDGFQVSSVLMSTVSQNQADPSRPGGRPSQGGFAGPRRPLFTRTFLFFGVYSLVTRGCPPSLHRAGKVLVGPDGTYHIDRLEDPKNPCFYRKGQTRSTELDLISG